MLTGWVLALSLAHNALAVCPAPHAVVRLASDPDAFLAAQLTLLRCARTDLQAGDWQAVDVRLTAARVATAQLSGDAAVRWLTLVDRLAATRVIDAHAWDEAPALTAPIAAETAWLREMVNGIADARRAWHAQERAVFDRVLRVADQLHTLAASRQDGDIRRAARLVQAAVAGGQYERDEMQLLLEEAQAAEAAGRDAFGEFYLPVVIAAELEADLWLQTDRYARAAEVYRQVIATHPGRVQPWLGLATANRRLGRSDDAADAADQARRLAPSFRFADRGHETP